MSYYWFNREELLKKANEKYHNKGGKEKAAKYYQDNKEKARSKYKNLTKDNYFLTKDFKKIGTIN